MVNGNGPIKTGAWDPEEDDLLYYWQSKVGNKWSEVAKHIPGRTGQQCAQRWRHKVNPNIRRDKWTAEEDAKLIELVKTFGVGRWAEIARNCDGRTDQQCMGRWRRHLDPSIRRDSWSPEEDAKLRQLHAQYGTSWSRISKCLKGRTSQQCRARWHQINNGRGSKSGPAAGSSSAGGGGKQAAAGRRGHAAKRKQSRRRSDFSDSEEEEEEEEEEELEEEDEDGDFEPDCDHSSSPNPHSSGAAAEAAAAAYYDAQAMAAVAAAAAAAAGGASNVYSLEVPMAAAAAAAAAHGGAHLQQQDWAKVLAGQAAMAAAAGHLQRDDLACGTDQEDEGDADEPEEAGEGSESEQAAAAGSRMHFAGGVAAGEPCDGLPVKLEQRTAIAARHRDTDDGLGRYGSSTWSSQQQQHHWSPRRLLLSPRQQARVETQQLQRKGSSSSSRNRSELNEEETAGAETLLQMAHLLRRESCEFEPPSLRRSDFITASTPPKRNAAERPEVRDSDELSPSPFKRARSNRGSLFGRPGADKAQQDSGLAGLGRGAAAAIEAAAAEEHMQSGDEPVSGVEAGRQPRVHGSLAANAASADEGDDYMDAGVEEEEEEEGAGLGEGRDPLLGFGLGSYPNGPLPDPPARPSNASSLTGVNAEAAAAGGSTAAAFLSPPPVARVPGSSSRWRESTGAMVTPRRPAAQQNLMNLLGSPSFDRMAGYASPPSAGRTQPSAATLAALQSPQPSCVHEPFWTPFTGLFKDALFTRGTSATPDLPSAGKACGSSVGLFSPGRKSNSASKAMPRRSLLASPAMDRTEPQRAAEDNSAAAAQAGSSVKACPAPCPADSEMGPSPAAACGLQAAQAVNHRVVRRLDQHEAWGTPHAAASAPKPTVDGPLGIGFSLFSPVKKQRVPRFDEGSITIGASPAKPEPTDLPGCTLTIAPLSHELPSSSECLPGNLSSPAPEPHSCCSPSSQAGVGLPHGRSPLGPKGNRGPTLSWKRPPASQLLSALPRHLLLQQSLQQREQQQQQQQQGQEQQQPQPETAQAAAGSPMAISPEAGAPYGSAEASAYSQDAMNQHQAKEQEQQQQHEQDEVPQQNQETSEDAPGMAGSPTDAPDTPVHLKQATSDNTSCSGTPNTPAERSSLARGAGTSPNEYVTPQQRLRLSRPLAPLHKDCLIAAATRSLAGMAGAQDPAGQAAAAASGKPAAGGAKCAAAGAPAPAAGSGCTTEASATEKQSGSAPNSADSSKHDGFMDSPLQPCQQLQSPTSQWHQGMVAMLRNLQQTPLQPCLPGGEGSAASDADAKPGPAEAGGKAGDGGAVRASSRALRRLQDELERGSGIAAAGRKPSDVKVALATPSMTRAGAGSTPMLLPLFSPAVPSAGPQVQQGTAAAVGELPTPVVVGRGSSVASVSLTPAIISCSCSEVFSMQGPGSAAVPALAAPTGLPAVAWPVQQRPDGGLVVTAPPGSGSEAAAATVLQLTPPPPDTFSSRLAAVSSNDSAAPACAGDGAAAAAAAMAALVQQQQGSMLSGQWPSTSRMAVVSVQPVTLLASMMGAAAATPAAAGLAAVQPMLALQPVKSCSSAVAETRKAIAGPPGMSTASTAQPERCDNSHAVRSRLHALIDGV